MQESGLSSAKKVAYFEYDFAKHGGAVGDITVQGDVIPKGAIITSGLQHCKTAFAGTSATLGVAAVGADDVRAAADITNLSPNAMLAVVPIPQTNTTWIRATANITALTLTVAVAALTAGKAVFALEYFVTE